MELNATVTLRREDAWICALVSFGIELDGRRVAKIARAETIQLHVSPGRHTLKIMRDWCSSNSLEFDIAAGETKHLKCGPSLHGVAVFFGVALSIFAPNRYLFVATDIHQIN